MWKTEEPSFSRDQQENDFSADGKGLQSCIATGLNVNTKIPLKEEPRLFSSDEEDIRFESCSGSSMLSDEDLTRLGIPLELCVRAYDTRSGEAKTVVCASKETVRKIRRKLNNEGALFHSSIADLRENGFEPVEKEGVLLKIISKGYNACREAEEALRSLEIPDNLYVAISLYNIYKEDWTSTKCIPNWLQNIVAVTFEETSEWPSVTDIYLVCKTPRTAADLAEKIEKDKQSIIENKPEVIEAKLNETIVRMINEGDLEGLKKLHAKENFDFSKPRPLTITLPERELPEAMVKRVGAGGRSGRARQAQKENEEWARAKTITIKTTIPCQAAAEGQLEIVRWLVEEQKVDIEAPNSEGYTMLFLAIKKQCVDTVNYLFEKNANVNVTDERGRTPLHSVIAGTGKGFDGLLATVLDKTKNVNAVSEDGITPLEWAFRVARFDIIEKLREKGAILFPKGVDVYWIKENIKKILFSAVREENCNVIEQFVPLLLNFKDEAEEIISSYLNEALYNSIIERYSSIMILQQFCRH